MYLCVSTLSGSLSDSWPEAKKKEGAKTRWKILAVELVDSLSLVLLALIFFCKPPVCGFFSHGTAKPWPDFGALAVYSLIFFLKKRRKKRVHSRIHVNSRIGDDFHCFFLYSSPCMPHMTDGISPWASLIWGGLIYVNSISTAEILIIWLYPWISGANHGADA